MCYNYSNMPEFDNAKYELPSDQEDSGMLNKLRAAVLGANDGIVSVASVAMGVAGATSDVKIISLAGMAALIAGALSMAVGEYVSVSSQSDAEKAYIELEKRDLVERPAEELEELTREYQKLGMRRATAEQVAREMTEEDALRAHLRVHRNIDPDAINNPWQAAWASLFAFTLGGLIPYIAVILSPASWRIALTTFAVFVALLVVGYLSAYVGNASKVRAITRVVFGGLLAMAITYAVGLLFGTTVG